MLTKFLAEEIAYSGRELSPHWILERTGVYGDALVAFVGPCRVATEALVDLQDRRAGDHIAAVSMLHFLGEFFAWDLDRTIAYQRLLTAMIADAVRELGSRSLQEISVRRRGDDVMIASRGGPERKLSVSIATASAVSTLLHFGVNVDPEGAPVAAIGLKELGINPAVFAQRVLQAWSEEMDSLRIARAKVLPRI